MKTTRTTTIALALSAALAVPALAQTATGAGTTGTGMNSTGTNSTGMPGAGTHPDATMPPAAMGQTTLSGSSATARTDNGNSTYMTSDNDVRASKLIGAAVYNDKDQKIGTVDELLMGSNHDVTAAVLSVGGFLGIDAKLVSVKIDQLQVKPDRVVMAGATKDDLTSMPTYKYVKSAS